MQSCSLDPNVDPFASLAEANACIARINTCETEAEVESLAKQLTHYLDLQDFVFVALHRCGGQEHYRYLFSCDTEWMFRYIQNRWYAIDPFFSYALHNTQPVLTAEIPLISPGQQRMLVAANEYGLHSGIVVPAHSAATKWLGALILISGDGLDQAQRSLNIHRYLMSAIGMELLEWCDTRHHTNLLYKFDLDCIDEALLRLARVNASADEAACELDISLSKVRWRYERLQQTFEAKSKRHAAEKAVALGIIPSA